MKIPEVPLAIDMLTPTNPASGDQASGSERWSKEREQEQRIAEGNLCKNNKHTHLLRRLNGMIGGRVLGGIGRGNGKNNSKWLLAQLECFS